MANLYNTIEELAAKNGISIFKMCKDIGIRQSVVSDLKHGRQSGISAKNLDKIAAYFGVSVSYLLGTEKEKAPSEDEAIRELAEAMLERPDVRSLMEVAMANNPSEVESMTEFMRKLRGGT